MSAPEQVERKSEARVALERELYRRARKGAPDEDTYGVDTWKSRDGRRWCGSAWFFDLEGLLVRVTVQNAPTGPALGAALLAAAEALPVPGEART